MGRLRVVFHNQLPSDALLHEAARVGVAAHARPIDGKDRVSHCESSAGGWRVCRSQSEYEHSWAVRGPAVGEENAKCGARTQATRQPEVCTSPPQRSAPPHPASPRPSAPPHPPLRWQAPQRSPLPCSARAPT
eukprot:2168713-Prymnesium_polylepis.1